MKLLIGMIAACLLLAPACRPGTAMAQSGQLACSTVEATVAGGSADETVLACQGARMASEAMARCGFFAEAPVEIAIVRKIYDDHGLRKLGDFTLELGKVRLLTQRAFQAHGKGKFAGVPVSMRDLYRSVAAHEAAHAIFYRYTAHLDLPPNAHEYVAYVTQVGTLPAEVGEAIMRSQTQHGQTQQVLNNLFNFSPFLLLADPQRFAAQAYRHFHATGNGCAFLHAVVAERVHFPPGGD